jgi:hypothetical protein
MQNNTNNEFLGIFLNYKKIRQFERILHAEITHSRSMPVTRHQLVATPISTQ